MAVAADSTVRAPAQQARSRATLERILIAAGNTFDEIGVGAATMEGIAQRAGVSIGSVYRFFSDKQAIAGTLAQRWQSESSALFAQLFTEESLTREAEEVIGEFIVGFRRLLIEFAGARGLLAADLVGRTSLDDGVWVRNLERFVGHYAPGLPRGRRRGAVQMYRTISRALMVTAADAGPGLEQHLREAHCVLVGYINQLAREGQAGEGKQRRT